MTECVHTPLQYIVEANIMYVVTLSGVMLCNVLLCVCVCVCVCGCRACRGTRGELLCLLFDICTNSHTALTANQTVVSD